MFETTLAVMMPCRNLAASGPDTESSCLEDRAARPEDGGRAGVAIELANRRRCCLQLRQTKLGEKSLSNERLARLRIIGIGAIGGYVFVCLKRDVRYVGAAEAY